MQSDNEAFSPPILLTWGVNFFFCRSLFIIHFYISYYCLSVLTQNSYPPKSGDTPHSLLSASIYTSSSMCTVFLHTRFVCIFFIAQSRSACSIFGHKKESGYKAQCTHHNNQVKVSSLLKDSIHISVLCSDGMYCVRCVEMV